MLIWSDDNPSASGLTFAGIRSIIYLRKNGKGGGRVEQKESRGLPQKVSEELIRLIQENGLRPGDRLPNEMVLAEKMSAGRSSVREAMKLLASRNIVEIRQGSGTYVSGKQGVSDDPLGLVFVKKDRKLALDLMDVRFWIEPPIAAMAAQNAEKEDKDAVERLCGETEEAIRRGEDHTQADIEFHRAIALSSKNLVVPRLIPIINRSIEVFIRLTDRALLEETVRSHREITRAILDGDPVGARDAMYFHLVCNRRFILKTADR